MKTKESVGLPVKHLCLVLTLSTAYVKYPDTPDVPDALPALPRMNTHLVF